jgi:hypothetical protein
VGQGGALLIEGKNEEGVLMLRKTSVLLTGWQWLAQIISPVFDGRFIFVLLPRYQ